MENVVFTPSAWIDVIQVGVAGVLAIIAAFNAGKIADAGSNTLTKVIEVIKAWRKK